MENNEENFDKLIKEIEEKEQTQGKPVNPLDDTDPYFAHIEVMKEEGLEKSDLPPEIQKMITTFQRKKAMAEKHPMKPETLADLQNLSVIIADNILDDLEDGLPDEPQEPKEIKDDGGIIDDASDADIIDDIDDDMEDGGEVKKPKKESEWGILGGIFDW